MLFKFTKLAALALIAPLLANATPTPILEERFDAHQGDITFYDPSVGIGACGHLNSGSELVVAMNHAVFDTFPGATANPNLNPICSHQIRINHNGLTLVASIVDRCEACGPEDIDLSPALFEQFAPLATGRVHLVNWRIL